MKVSPVGRPASADDGGLRFAERVLSLIDSGRKSATYKLATLMALIDVVAESSDPHFGAPDVVSGRAVAQRVIEMYWPQSAVYGTGAGDTALPLRQSPQNDIPAKLHAWRVEHQLGDRTSLDSARAAAPQAFIALERDLVATVLRMPIPKLQRFGEGRNSTEDRFIYDFGWSDEAPKATVLASGFDDRLHLQPNVGQYLVRLAPLLRPAIQAKWSALVARQNSDLVDAHQLDEFLFGATRIDLSPLRSGLVAAQGGRCFYCEQAVRSSAHVDHFIPWSRHPDNTLDNLVAAHAECNNRKSASIAGSPHLEAWLHRTCDPVLEELAGAVNWPRRRDRTQGSVTATYLWLPPGARLWLAGTEFEQADPAKLSQLLTTVVAQRHEHPSARPIGS